MSERCKALHEIVDKCFECRYPVNMKRLPHNGIYFFYESGETWGHGGNTPRVVRVGTHRNGNFQSRIRDHYIPDTKMDFDVQKPAPHDRSIFRKNIGRAILNRDDSDYLQVWNIDFTTVEKRERYSHLRDIEFEKNIEQEITRLLQENFSFRYIPVEDETERMGKTGLESRLIGTLSSCHMCQSSDRWLGQHSPVEKIKQSGLWQYQHLYSSGLTDKDMTVLSEYVNGM